MNIQLHIHIHSCPDMFIYKYNYISLNKISGFTLCYHITSNPACIVNELLTFSSMRIGLYPMNSNIRYYGKNSQIPLCIWYVWLFFPYMIHPKSVKRFGFCLFITTCSKGPALHRHSKALYAASSSPGVQSFPAAPGCVVM